MTQAGFEANGSTSKLRKNDVKISKTEVNVAQSGEITRSNLDQITPENLAALWASGAIIAASLADKALKGATTQKFQSADVLMVRVDLAKLPLKAALAADFTQRYATVACHTVTDGGGELLLAFQLPATVVDAVEIRRRVAALAWKRSTRGHRIMPVQSRATGWRAERQWSWVASSTPKRCGVWIAWVRRPRNFARGVEHTCGRMSPWIG